MLILASASPRRRELLEMIGIPFTCIPSQGEEEAPEELAVEKLAEYLALQKAEDVQRHYPKDTVLGSDTLVEIDGEVLGKPGSQEEAFSMILRLSGRSHRVYTGVSILPPRSRESFTRVTQVEFYSLTDEEIREYICTGEPMDKAGAYGIQGRGATLVKQIQGDFYTVMGLPIAEVARKLRRLG